jgi:hypothetical protein
MKSGLTKGTGLLWLMPSIFCLSMLFPPYSSAQGSYIECSQNLIKVKAFFHGTWVKIHGRCPSGAKVLVEVVGEDEREILMKMGRRGPFWMNVAEVHIEGVPNLYLLLGHPEMSLATPSNKIAFRDGKNCGYGRLLQRARIGGSHVDEAEKVKLFEEFVNLKESESLYGIMPNAIHVEPTGDGDHFEGRFWLPPRVYAGDYEVRPLLAIGNEILQGSSTKIKVIRVGLPAILSSLAVRQPALYGILAVVVAMATGLLMGVVFRHRRARHP